jgi:hypothetical protein
MARRPLGIVLGAALATAPCALAQTPTTTPTPSPTFKLGGYAEVFLSHNFNDPDNRITNDRGFDNREDKVAIDNVVVDVTGSAGAFSAHVTLQAGLTPDTYYASEPGDRAWRHVQQAYAGYNAPVGKGLLVEGGIFLSPIGPENVPIKDNWNWSRSDLFFGLPFYHAGVRATYALSSTATLMAMLCNGWNDVVDGNSSKSVMAQLQLKGPRNLEASLIYMGGSERPTGAPEGQPWRHLFDGWVRFDATQKLSLQLCGDGGFEENRFGRSSWLASAVYARFKVRPLLPGGATRRPPGPQALAIFLAARGDVFWESVPDGTTPIFWSGATRVASATFTVDVRPLSDHLAVMLEARRDWATNDIYSRNASTARAQTTLTLGVTGWF